MGTSRHAPSWSPELLGEVLVTNQLVCILPGKETEKAESGRVKDGSKTVFGTKYRWKSSLIGFGFELIHEIVVSVPDVSVCTQKHILCVNTMSQKHRLPELRQRS